MKYEINQEQLEKLLKIYFNQFFDKSVYEGRKYGGDNQFWKGWWDGNTLLVGRPLLDRQYDKAYYSNGQVLNGWDLFSLDHNDFRKYLKKYLEERYKVKIETLI